MGNLVQCEFIEGKWCVVFYPFVGCDLEDAMLLSKHDTLELAQQYAKHFKATMAVFLHVKK